MNDQITFVPQTTSDGVPYVVFQWGGMVGQFDVVACRRAALALLEAAEQAQLEADMHSYLVRDGGDQAGAARIIQHFREHRAQAGFPTEGDPA